MQLGFQVLTTTARGSSREGTGIGVVLVVLDSIGRMRHCCGGRLLLLLLLLVMVGSSQRCTIRIVGATPNTVATVVDIRSIV